MTPLADLTPLEAQLVRIGRWMASTFFVVMLSVVGAVAAGAYWVAEKDVVVKAMARDIREVKSILLQDIESRLRELERARWINEGEEVGL